MKKLILLTTTFLVISCLKSQHSLTINNTTTEDVTISVDELEDLATPTNCGGSTVSTTYLVRAGSSILLYPTAPGTGTFGSQDLIFTRVHVLTASTLPVTTSPLDWTPNPSYNIYTGRCNTPGTGIYTYTSTFSGTTYTSIWTFSPGSGALTPNLNTPYDDVSTLF